MAFEALKLLMRLEVPDAHGAVDPASLLEWPAAAREGPAAVRRESHAPYLAGVALQASQAFTSFHVPEAHGPVCRAGESTVTIRREGYAPYEPPMTVEAAELFPGFRVPQ